MSALIRDTFRAMLRGIEPLFENGEITLSQWLALEMARQGRVTCIGDVNRELGLESGTSTRLIDQLEGKELLRQRRCQADRRVVKIEVTDKGEQIILATKPRVREFWDQQLGVFSGDEKEFLFSMLTRLKDGLKF